jgi:RNA polymerase sigma-70 factor, ECF subfamily
MEMLPENDSSLVPRLKRGEADAFEQMVRAFSPRLLSSATRILGNPDEAAEAVQESLISAWKNIHRFEEASSIYTWLHRIVINACLARLRASRSRKEVSFADGAQSVAASFEAFPGARIGSGPSLEKQTAMRRVLQRALESIPADLRLVLLLRDIEELSSKETAAKLGISDALVRQRLHRARAIMAEMLRPELCDGPELTCGGQLDLLLDYIDDSLPPDFELPVHDHIHACPACTNLLAVYRSTIGLPRVWRDATEIQVAPNFIEVTVRAALGSTRTSSSVLAAT